MTGNSWLSLVTSTGNLESAKSYESLLSAAHADYSVVTNQVYVYDRFVDAFVQVPNRFVTGREIDERLENWEVVKERYEVEQNQKILERAHALIRKYNGSAVFTGCGVLDEGRKFFAVVRTGSITIPTLDQSSDIIDSYIVIMTSHDGSIPICYYNLDSRRSNNTTYRFSSSPTAEFSIRKRHTPSGVNLNEEVTEALNMRTNWSEYMGSAIGKLFVPASASTVDKALEKFWPTEYAATEKKREHAEGVHETITDLYHSSNNVGAFGTCRWSLLSAINEYIDFHRNIPDDEAAQHSLEIDNYSHRLKLNVFQWLNTF